MRDEPIAPVVLFIYNRPDVTARVFEAIRLARPRRLFVFADGGRGPGPGDAARIDAAREVTTRVDWPCDVVREYAAGHLGIKRRVESGLDRVFADVDRAIILEDDCLPDPTFFRFAGELLERYRDDTRVLSVCGSRRSPRRPSVSSYDFSRYQFLWGWATWRRAWGQYDRGMRAWSRLRETTWLAEQLHDRHAWAYWTYLFDTAWQAGDAGDWDVAFSCSSWVAGGLSILPACNLISNLGFRADATHTSDERHAATALPVTPMPFPLRHPDRVAASVEEDHLAATSVFSGNLTRLMNVLHGRVRAGAAR